MPIPILTKGTACNLRVNLQKAAETVNQLVVLFCKTRLPVIGSLVALRYSVWWGYLLRVRLSS